MALEHCLELHSTALLPLRSAATRSVSGPAVEWAQELVDREVVALTALLPLPPPHNSSSLAAQPRSRRENRDNYSAPASSLTCRIGAKKHHSGPAIRCHDWRIRRDVKLNKSCPNMDVTLLICLEALRESTKNAGRCPGRYSKRASPECKSRILKLHLSRLNYFPIIYTNPVRTSQETHYVSSTTPNWLMLFGETVADYCQNHRSRSRNRSYFTTDSQSVNAPSRAAPVTIL
jgi:hypothetical protein